MQAKGSSSVVPAAITTKSTWVVFAIVFLCSGMFADVASAQPACAAAWNAATAYSGGAVVSRDCGGNKNFTAQFWTQGNDPCTNNGPGGTGEEWFTGVACGGGGT